MRWLELRATGISVLFQVPAEFLRRWKARPLAVRSADVVGGALAEAAGYVADDGVRQPGGVGALALLVHQGVVGVQRVDDQSAVGDGDRVRATGGGDERARRRCARCGPGRSE